MMDEDDIRRDSTPLRTATVVAEGHLVLLEMSTAEARARFKGDRLNQIKKMNIARKDVLALYACDTAGIPHAGAKTNQVTSRTALLL
jgi:hypothetical protein